MHAVMPQSVRNIFSLVDKPAISASRGRFHRLVRLVERRFLPESLPKAAASSLLAPLSGLLLLSFMNLALGVLPLIGIRIGLFRLP